MSKAADYQRFRHYKGKLYEVIAEAVQTETNEPLVIYREVDQPDKVWARPQSMFYETVEIDCQIIPRFQPLDQA